MECILESGIEQTCFTADAFPILEFISPQKKKNCSANIYSFALESQSLDLPIPNRINLHIKKRTWKFLVVQSVCFKLTFSPLSTEPASHQATWLESFSPGVLTLTWYTSMCLPFEVLFHKIWYSDWWVFIRDKGAQIQKLGVFWANYCVKDPIWADWVLSYQKWYTDGWVIGQKINIEKVKFLRFGSHTHVRFGKSSSPGFLDWA